MLKQASLKLSFHIKGILLIIKISGVTFDYNQNILNSELSFYNTRLLYTYLITIIHKCLVK